MSLELSRRALMGAAAAAPILTAAPARAMPARAALPSFGPPANEAHLVFNENPYGPAPSAVRAMAEVAAQGCYYMDDVEPRLTATLAERFKVAPEQIVLGNGSFEVLAAGAFAWSKRGRIVCPELMFDEPIDYAVRQGARVQRVPLAADMGVDLAALAAAVDGDTALVYLCNPNNPTGMLIDPAALRAFIRGLDPKVTVIVDEAYNELTDRPEQSSVVDLVREGRNLIVTRTFSKIYGMAGLRVGYAIASPDKAKVIRDHATTIGLNSAGLAAALASYNDREFTRYSLARIVEARAMLVGALHRHGLKVLPTQANFLFVEVPDANAFRDAMAARGIRIRGAYGKWTRWSRVSTGRIEHVQRYIAALPEVLKA